MRDARNDSIEQFLRAEAWHLDKRQWDEWLALYAEDAEYWVPAWDTEDQQTKDPNNELSLIYYGSRKGLEDRVFRLRSGRSVASAPAPRTCHNVFNVRARLLDGGMAEVDAGWQVLSYRLGQTSSFFGFYEYLLKADGESWKIKRKKITLMNDLIPSLLDVHLI
jgi:3-phenylpropionate/cinnamic acid dioxygenase small subunit